MISHPKLITLLQRTVIGLAAPALLALVGTAEAAGPTSTLYLTAGDQHRDWRVLPGTTIGLSSAQVETGSGGEYALAISGGVIRTAGNGQFGAPLLGSTYNLNFTYITPRLANPLNDILDGTTDGTFNYGVSYTTRNVYRCNLDWSSPTLIFNAAAVSGSVFGVSYASAGNSLWIGDSSGKLVDYSLGGAVLSSINTPGSSNLAVAYDGADGTLWTMQSFNSGVFRQYSTAGALLQTMNISSSDNIIGGEFALIPEPTSAALLGFGTLLLAARRRRRAQA